MSKMITAEQARERVIGNIDSAEEVLNILDYISDYVEQACDLNRCDVFCSISKPERHHAGWDIVVKKVKSLLEEKGYEVSTSWSRGENCWADIHLDWSLADLSGATLGKGGIIPC